MTYEQLTLHVGLPKTGTTTIQSFLDVNQQRLNERGIFYVGPHALRSYPMDNAFWEEDRLRAGLQEIKQRATPGTTHLLWSNEWLSTSGFVKDAKYPKLIQRELPASRCRVVIYLRRQDHRIGSMYLQAGIRSKEYPGPVLGFNDWLRWTLGDRFQNLLPANVDYAGLIQPWIEVFGGENVVIRVLEKEQLLGGDLLQDFCDAVKLPTADYVFEVPNKNVSFNMELHDMLGMYNSVFEEGGYSGDMIQFIESLGEDEFFAKSFFSRFAIPPKCRIEILQHCEESNRKVAKEFMGREDAVLFREPWPRPDDPYEPYSGLTTDKLVPILLHILQKQDERIHKLELLARQLNVAGVARSITRKLTRGITSLVNLGKNGAQAKGEEE